MARKKSPESARSSDEQALVQRVDAMMSAEPAASLVSAPVATPMPIKVASDSVKPTAAEAEPKTAPELPSDVLKKLKTIPAVSAAATKSTKPPLTKPALPLPEFTPEPEPAALEPEPESSVAAELNLEDTETDKAVDDIVANEGDTMLALEDLKAQRRPSVEPPKRSGRLRRFFKSKKALWLVPILLLLVFGVPTTRYKLLGLVLKKTISVAIIDAKTAAPVSDAQVRLGTVATKTDAQGLARLKVGVGPHAVTISKQYYQTTSDTYFVGIANNAAPRFSVTATGRLVPITILNKVSGLPVAGATIHVLNTTAKTNAKGLASIALPVGKSTQAATITLAGYNSLSTPVQVTGAAVAANSFQLTPAGQIYFLANDSDGIDVVKTNLDGSGRKVVLEASGHENPKTTSLLESADGRYVVLKSQREGDQPALYLIDTSSDKVTEFDNSSSSFNLIGWYDHDFMYELTSTSAPAWQSGAVAIKSYDADHQQLNQLDQNQAEGSAGDYAVQSFSNFSILNNQLVYSTQWQGFSDKLSGYDLSGETDSIRSVQANGQGKKDDQQFPANSTSAIQSVLYQPQAAYFAVTSGNSTQYYNYQNQAVQTTSIDAATFNQGYPTYLVSPSGTKSFWADQNNLYVGDANGQNKQQLTNASSYTPYGWYGNNYVLVSQDGALYILPSSGLTAGHQPFKITDYFSS